MRLEKHIGNTFIRASLYSRIRDFTIEFHSDTNWWQIYIMIPFIGWLYIDNIKGIK